MNNIWVVVVAILSGILLGLLYFRAMHTNTVKPVYLYKIVSVEDWITSKDQERVKLSSMDSNFIHLATEAQVDKIIAKFWAEASEVVVLKLETTKLPGELRFEQNPGGKNKYYHLYNGFIPSVAVIASEIRRVR